MESGQGGLDRARQDVHYIRSRLLKGVSEKTSRFDFCIFRLLVHFLLSSQETYLFPLKIEVSPVVLYIINFHSSNYGLRFTQPSLYFTLEIWNNNKIACNLIL